MPDCGAANGRRNLTFMPGLRCDDTTSACKWTCGATTYDEICSDGIDNDLDGNIDCEDTDCQVPPITGTNDISGLICFGTDHYTSSDDLSAMAGIQWQCGQGVDAFGNDVVGVGLCCAEGYRPERNPVGVWRCEPSQPCYPISEGPCGFDYSSQFVSWVGDSNCLDSSAPLACCNVIQFGSEEYWSDEGNVVIY